MFEQFPKKRPSLPKEIEEIYSTHYKANREGATAASSLSQKMEAWLHKQVAKDVYSTKEPITTLEIGAGTLNQLAYEPVCGPYDIVEPFEELYSNSKVLDRIRNIYPDISEIPEHQTYDRITSIATFEHVCDLPNVIAKSGILLAPGGTLRVSIPNEGTPLWTLGWKLTTGIEFRMKYGLDYGRLMRYEHVNTAKEIGELLTYFFKEVKCKVFGLSKYFSFYRFYSCSNPNLERCRSIAFNKTL